MLPGAKLPAVHGALHAQRALQGARPNTGTGPSDALKAIFAMESRDIRRWRRPGSVAAEMEARKLKAAANCLREGIGETTDLPARRTIPAEHRRRIRTNNMIERLNKEIRRRHPGRGRLPRLQQRAHARMRQNPLRHLTLVVGPAIHGHVPGSMTT